MPISKGFFKLFFRAAQRHRFRIHSKWRIRFWRSKVEFVASFFRVFQRAQITTPQGKFAGNFSHLSPLLPSHAIKSEGYVRRILLLGNGLVAMPVIDYFERSSAKLPLGSKIKMTAVGLTPTLSPSTSNASGPSCSVDYNGSESKFSFSYLQCDLLNNEDLLKSLVSSHDIVIR